MYPSVSICKRYAFDNDKDIKSLRFENTSTEDIANVIQKNSWNIDEQLYFFTHPGTFNLTFPCTTALGGRSPGKPCVFPVYYNNWIGFEGVILYTCQTEGLQLALPGCITKVGEENEYEILEENWGYCSKHCNGEVPGGVIACTD